MQQTLRALPLFAVLLLAGCSMGPSTTDVAMGPTLPGPNSALVTAPQPTGVAATPAPGALGPVQMAATASNATSDVSTFIDAGVLVQLSAKDKAEASAAQVNALTFSRPGAPRSWVGDKGTTGNVTVGPIVKVNNIDCRDFTHTVTIAGTPHAKKGTACRDASNTWSVAG